MPDTRTLVPLTADIYDAAVDEMRWPGLLERIAAPLGARGTALLVLENREDFHYQISTFSEGYGDVSPIVREYEREFAHHEADHFSRVAVSEPGRIVIEPGFLEDRLSMLERPDVKFLADKLGILDRFAVRLNDDRAWFDCLTAQYPPDRGNASKEEQAALALIWPHVAAVVAMSRAFHKLKQHYQAVLTMLDHLSVGLMLVLPSGRVLLSNASANEIIDAQPHLRIHTNGRLTSGNSAVDAELQQALRVTSDTACGIAAETSRTIITPPVSSGSQCLLEINPIGDGQNELGEHFRGSLVTLIDTGIHGGVRNIDGFQALYALSSAESDVATLIAQGLSSRDIADARGVSLETARSQIKALLRKTDSRNRVELVRRIMTVQLPLR